VAAATGTRRCGGMADEGFEVTSNKRNTNSQVPAERATYSWVYRLALGTNLYCEEGQ
jgi:hypothetical protein